ncbi:Uncharacterised protein [uncultured archaeon]|nr:Uncharacterised protein [uncultured archaeon]
MSSIPEHDYPKPSATLRSTVSYCDLCERQTTWSYGKCDGCINRQLGVGLYGEI